MKKIALAAVVVGALIFALGYLYGEHIDTAQSAAPAGPQLTDRQATWLDALIWCESKAVPSAVNPKDRDGTPSYGYLQFKPSTLAYFEQKYGITGPLMSSTTQKEIVTQMILQGGVDWRQQFPACVRALGTPPTN